MLLMKASELQIKNMITMATSMSVVRFSRISRRSSTLLSRVSWRLRVQEWRNDLTMQTLTMLNNMNGDVISRVLSDFRRDHVHGSGVEHVRPAGCGLDLRPAWHVEQKCKKNRTVKYHFHLLTGAPTLGNERVADAEETVRAHHQSHADAPGLTNQSDRVRPTLGQAG
ncbi:hypothetical protein T4E_10568 [Trichinella pseudospiralis]|uniref:Uncharacterized protein n=1 Tax=Trichinella pseudospiralis TaxID=6337 RepID=A0A0V0YGL8_TRIPS|nr:hypothetical protein T4E_10568 [Trichinella pseudospiralis]